MNLRLRFANWPLINRFMNRILRFKNFNRPLVWIDSKLYNKMCIHVVFSIASL